MASKQEILELIVGIKDIVLDLKKVMADGKVDVADLAVINDLVKQQGELVAAVQGLADIKLAELGIGDAVEIVEALAKAGQEVSAA